MQKLDNGSIMELYVKPEHPLPDNEKRLERARENAVLARQMGAGTLAAQDVLNVNSSTAVEWCKSQGLQPLTSEERAAWVDFLPTGYYSERGRDVRHKRPDDTPWRLQMDIREYQHHEGMPRHIRELFVKVDPLFSMMEIRTTETIADLRRDGRLSFDPALFGHVINTRGQREIYLLARWGESDANFIRSFDDLKTILKTRTGFVSPRTWLHRRLYGNPLSWDDDSRFMNLLFMTISCTFLGLLSSFLFLGMASAEWRHSGTAPTTMSMFLVLGASIPWLLLLADSVKARARKRALEIERPDLARFV